MKRDLLDGMGHGVLCASQNNRACIGVRSIDIYGKI